MRKTLTMAGILAGIELAVAVLAPANLAYAGDQLTITAWGGAYQAALRKVFFQPFTKASGVKITEDEWTGQVSKVRAMVETKTVSWDVLDVGADVQTLCSQGLIEAIDWKKLGLDPTKFMGDDKVHECGLPHQSSSTVIAYNKNKLPNGPKTIADFFDTNKFPGKRGLNKSPFTNLEWALIADGVAKRDVYKVLATPEGVDRAFKKLDTIKKDIIWWTTPPQPAQLLADNQVVMTSAYYGRIYDAVKHSGMPFEVTWDAQMLSLDFWVILKGSPNRESAYKFLAFSGSTEPQSQMARELPYSPGNTDTMALIDPTIRVDLPTAPEHMGNALEADYSFWSEKRDELDQRFTAWLSR